jgi:hypothetical protein
VASLDAARRARQVRAEQEVKEAAAAMWNQIRVEQVHMPYPADSPLGRAVENALSSAFPRRQEADSVEPVTINTQPKPQVPSEKAD